MLTSFEIRQKFIDFFVENGHTLVPSLSLIHISLYVSLTHAQVEANERVFEVVQAQCLAQTLAVCLNELRIGGSHLGVHLVTQVCQDRLADEHEGDDDAGEAEQAQGIASVECLAQVIAPVAAAMGLQFGQLTLAPRGLQTM